MKHKHIIWLLNSRAYKKATSAVGTMIKNPKTLLDLVSKAELKKPADLSKNFEPLITPINSLFRLLKAYSSGEYRDISIKSLGLIVASIIYFVMPLDAIPDFILALGHIDDAALIAWTIRSVSSDLDRFLAWEDNQKSNSSAIEIQN